MVEDAEVSHRDPDRQDQSETLSVIINNEAVEYEPSLGAKNAQSLIRSFSSYRPASNVADGPHFRATWLYREELRHQCNE